MSLPFWRGISRVEPRSAYRPDSACPIRVTPRWFVSVCHTKFPVLDSKSGKCCGEIDNAKTCDSNHSGNHPLHYGGLCEERRRAANRESIPEQRIGPRGRTEALRETLRRVPWSNSRGNRARAVPSRVCAFCRAPHAAYIH